MNRSFLFLSFLFIFYALFSPTAFSFAKKPAAPSAAASPAAKKYYMCPMRCQLSEKPGKCPKCGMEMWEVSS